MDCKRIICIVALLFSCGVISVDNLDFLDLELDGVLGGLVFVILDGVADVEPLAGMDVVEEVGLVEGDAVEDLAGGVIHQFELDMFELSADKLGGAEVHHVAGAEYRFVVARTEWVETAQGGDEFRSDFRECQQGVDFVGGLELGGEDVCRHILLETAGEFGDVLLLEGETDGVGMAAEVLQQVAGGVHG